MLIPRRPLRPLSMLFVVFAALTLLAGNGQADVVVQGQTWVTYTVNPRVVTASATGASPGALYKLLVFPVGDANPCANSTQVEGGNLLGDDKGNINHAPVPLAPQPGLWAVCFWSANRSTQPISFAVI